MAARCAAEHGRYWEYHDLLFAAQPAFQRSDLILYARRLGLPLENFAASIGGGRYRAAVRKDVEEGRAAGVTGTPSFFVNGVRLVGIQPLDMFHEMV
jgi:protein-disulfide isomerase